ncbi:hypothetical protein BU24DRAFT_427180 [Aaosphaeria arxii CBS 175.79]|uniref:Uncharacterized protein n=1 Tax=Aaosphaeria arxii CBS 175.79 TaxID=1450172 RepID=A0A6A5XDK9_9PLEO|nr:uncharacterized protein BU24DRAFT_427180 [Aaosphaeria arxii CBS 175.79]KAF2010979.1 hypothetical protein BU24DRAFT_427180 [Aaosphaeria arxii CBS 175.79]
MQRQIPNTSPPSNPQALKSQTTIYSSSNPTVLSPAPSFNYVSNTRRARLTLAFPLPLPQLHTKKRHRPYKSPQYSFQSALNSLLPSALHRDNQCKHPRFHFTERTRYDANHHQPISSPRTRGRKVLRGTKVSHVYRRTCLLGYLPAYSIAKGQVLGVNSTSSPFIPSHREHPYLYILTESIAHYHEEYEHIHPLVAFTSINRTGEVGLGNSSSVYSCIRLILDYGAMG